MSIFVFCEKIARKIISLKSPHIIRRRAPRKHVVRKRGGFARGGAGARACHLYPAPVRTDARHHTPRRTPTFRARRTRLTSCQTARASAHRAVHLDRPGTKARACSWRHAEAQTLGDDAEQRVYTCGSRSYSPSICSPQVRASLVLACLRFLLPKRRLLTKLFSPFDAQSGTVSLRRSSMPNDGRKKCALRIDARCPRPIRLHRVRCPSTACKTHPLTFIPPQGIALVCSDCETTETSRWCTNKDDKDKPVCVVCYKRQACHARRSHASIFQIYVSSRPDPNTRGAPVRSSLPAMASAPVAVTMGQIQAKCEGRSSRSTRGTAYRVTIKRCAFHDSSFFLSLCSSDPVGMITSVTSCFVSTHVVRVPYSSQELAIETAAGTTCVVCRTDRTVIQWYNSKDEPENKMCNPCYEKNRLDVAVAAGTTCVKCETDTTSKWYSCKDEPGTKICISCYQKNMLDVAAAAGTTCVKCGTDTTFNWYNCKDEPGTKICMGCYDKNSCEKKKAAKANEK